MDLLDRLPGRIVVLLLLGLAFGWVGPYGTYVSLGLAARSGYWILAMLLIGLPASALVRWLMRTPPAADWPPVIQALLGAIVIGLPGAVVAIALQTIFIAAPAITAASLAQIYGYVTVLAVIISVPHVLMRAYHRRSAAPSAPGAAVPPLASEAKPSAPDPSPFLRRIPAKLGTDLLCVATEDHYLRVVTDRGSDLILFRLSDALAELKSLPGQQVHRSYWVAERAIATVEQHGHRTFLVLTHGNRIPVSQTFLPALRQAGWLDKKRPGLGLAPAASSAK